MIEIRLRAAVSNPGSRPWRWGVSLAALVLAVIAPVATSRAQDATWGNASGGAAELETLRAMKVVTIDGGESIAITSGAASITLKKDGTIVLKGTDIVIDGASNVRARLPPVPQSLRASQMSEVF